MADPHDVRGLPYKIAVLCYLYDTDGRLLLLHRRKPPNSDMYSPIGGKLEAALGESPHDCAQREIWEEAQIRIKPEEIRLIGMVNESNYEASGHWLLFLFEVTRPINPAEIPHTEFDEGRLEWHAIADVNTLVIPDTDRRIMWPAVQAHRGGFFSLDIDCSVTPFNATMRESWKNAWKKS